jgi:hypothetical protein
MKFGLGRLSTITGSCGAFHPNQFAISTYSRTLRPYFQNAISSRNFVSSRNFDSSGNFDLKRLCPLSATNLADEPACQRRVGLEGRHFLMRNSATDGMPALAAFLTGETVFEFA